MTVTHSFFHMSKKKKKKRDLKAGRVLNSLFPMTKVFPTEGHCRHVPWDELWPKKRSQQPPWRTGTHCDFALSPLTLLSALRIVHFPTNS